MPASPSSPASRRRAPPCRHHLEVGARGCDVQICGVQARREVVVLACAYDVLEPQPAEDGKRRLKLRIFRLRLR